MLEIECEFEFFGLGCAAFFFKIFNLALHIGCVLSSDRQFRLDGIQLGLGDSGILRGGSKIVLNLIGLLFCAEVLILKKSNRLLGRIKFLFQTGFLLLEFFCFLLRIRQIGLNGLEGGLPILKDGLGVIEIALERIEFVLEGLLRTLFCLEGEGECIEHVLGALCVRPFSHCWSF